MKLGCWVNSSAAALFATSGAFAADAVEVVAEPEPVGFVRICDTYGEGFYYIPGTETCLRVGGFLRYDIGVGSFGMRDVLDKRDGSLRDSYYKNARASLQLDARSETELGTLRGFTHLNFDYETVEGDYAGGVSTTTGTAIEIEHAYIELGGFRVGKTDSLFSTFTDYASGVINDDLIGYGPLGTHQISYTFDAGNGFTAALGLETGGGEYDFDFDQDGTIDATADIYSIDSYIPNVVAGVGYSGDWGSVKAVGGYDSVWEEFAGKVRIDVKASEAISFFAMGGWKSGRDYDADGDGNLDLFKPNYYGNWGGDWAVWGGLAATVSEQATINVQVSYDQDENFAAVANVAYELVPGLTITPEIAYTDNFNTAGADDFGGYLRFERNF